MNGQVMDYDKYEIGFRILEGDCPSNCIHCGKEIKYGDRPNEYFEHYLEEHLDDNTTKEIYVGYTCLECDSKILDGGYKKCIDTFLVILQQSK